MQCRQQGNCTMRPISGHPLTLRAETEVLTGYTHTFHELRDGLWSVISVRPGQMGRCLVRRNQGHQVDELSGQTPLASFVCLDRKVDDMVNSRGKTGDCPCRLFSEERESALDIPVFLRLLFVVLFVCPLRKSCGSRFAVCQNSFCFALV